MEDEDTFGYHESACPSGPRKRSRRAMVEEDRRLDQLHRRSSSAPRYPNAPSASLNRNFPPPPIVRFPGDGLDFRRPIMPTTTISSTESERDVIDLTLEEPDQPPRPQPRPRGAFTPAPGQEIIYLDDDDDDDDDDEEDDEGRGESVFDVTESDTDIFSNIPDVELLYSRPRSVAPQSVPEYARDARGENSAQIQNNARQQREGAAPQQARRSPPMAQSGLPSTSYYTGFLHNAIPRFLSQRRALPSLAVDLGLDHDVGGLQVLPGFNQPDLNFAAVGFDMGRNNAPPAPRPRPTYEAPPAPLEGFIRTPAEEDTVICPNCDCELGQGDDEMKRQIWVIRSCGHVYCGQCAKGRSKKTKAALRVSKPFSTCVVDGCGKTKLTGKNPMFPLYISA